MKTIFTVTTEHDGLQNAAFSNVKALYEFIVNELHVTSGTLDGNGRGHRIVFNYANFLKGIRVSQSTNRFFVSHIVANDDSGITVNELGVLTK